MKFFVVLVLSIFCSSCLCIGSESSDTILTGQSLFPNETIISKEGRFELGFFTPGNSSNYYVGIWYKNIPFRTIVWVANRNRPISSSFHNDSHLEMSNGTMHLYVNMERIWSVGTSNATEAVILDTGHFVMRNAAGIIIWQSFDYPTDTWLPGGRIGFWWFSHTEAKLVSWKNPNDPSTGNYSLGIGLNGRSNELFIKRNGTQSLWRSGGNFSSLSDDSELRNFYNITYLSRGECVYFVYNVSMRSMISRIVVDYVGIMRHLMWSETFQTWATVWIQPSNPCRSYDFCGSNAICENSISTSCSCLKGFIPRIVQDWDMGVFSGGCVRRNSSCSDENGFTKLSNVILPANSESFGVIELDKCELRCAVNCSCNGFAYSKERGCLLFMGDLARLENSSAGMDLYIRMDTLSSLHQPRKGNMKILCLVVIVLVSTVILVCMSICYFRWKRKGKVSQGAHQDLLLLDWNSNGSENNKRRAISLSRPGEDENNKYELPTFSFSIIVTATNDFSMANKLGEGGFGPVYKGKLLSGQFVAVKRLSRKSGQGLEEFKNEIELIAKLQHRNLVGILGCCIENDEKILVYEYMPNKSLDFFLFDSNMKGALEWDKRVCIIEGIAQGLLYLHHYSRLRIIHRDLKASNILLDAEMNPKISDFGMARIFGGCDSHEKTTRIVGTYGYMSPEYALDGVFSIKSDVFAFGVLMLEIISGKKSAGFFDSDNLNLLAQAWNLWTNNRGLELVDPALELHSSSFSLTLRYIQIGLLCVQEDPGDRPTMLDVVTMLNNEQTSVASPKHPAFTAGRRFTKASSGEDEVEMCSVSDLTVSVIEAR